MQILGEAMAGISHNAKNSNLPEFGDSVSSASKALCGLTEAAAQVKTLCVCVKLLAAKLVDLKRRCVIKCTRAMMHQTSGVTGAH